MKVFAQVVQRLSEMSESRCFGAMTVGGIEMLLGSDGGKSNSVSSVRLLYYRSVQSLD